MKKKILQQINTYLLSPLRAGSHIRPSPETSMTVCLGTKAGLVPTSNPLLSSPSPLTPPCLLWSTSFSCFPLGVRQNANLLMELGCILHTSPNHLHLLISGEIGVVLVLRYSLSLYTLARRCVVFFVGTECRKHQAWT